MLREMQFVIFDLTVFGIFLTKIILYDVCVLISKLLLSGVTDNAKYAWNGGVDASAVNGIRDIDI